MPVIGSQVISDSQAEVYESLFPDHDLPWLMGADARCAMLYLLQHVQPECAIEIGTRFGGSLSAITRHAKRVFSLDIDPTCEDRLSSRFPNVEFIAGSSHVTLAPLLARLAEERAALSFVLIDGDHSADGVRLDVEPLLDYVPQCPLYVLMHDSFNPECRRGMLEAPWRESPYVHWVSVDFVAGGIDASRGPGRGQMWGGFGLAHLRPEPRAGELRIAAHQAWRYRITYRASAHRHRVLRPMIDTVRRRLRRFLGSR